ncbi:MAG: FAD:protein FMN transferase [Clostridia bacterium]|nr:FAD:protein FMN transferase [Clostridia bacterium]
MKRYLCFVLCIIICVSLCGCKPQKFTEYSFDFFDTVTTIVGYEKDKETFDKRCEEIKNKLSEYHKLYNIYNVYDGVNNLALCNQTKNGEHSIIKVDTKIIEMLNFAKDMYKQTNGKLNVAFGSVLNIWHQHREEGINNPESATLPKMENLQMAAQHTNIEDVVINEENNTVYLRDGVMRLDVGGVAKGYAVEQVAQWMEEEGYNGYILNVGGNVRCVGKRADGEKWKVGIESPYTDNVEIPYIEYLSIDNMSLVTSGSYQRFYVVKGNSYHHIIDPVTLMPAENFWSVSVLCKDSGLADALSTALFTMDYEQGLEIIESTAGAEAMWFTKDGEKQYSSGFKNYCVEE